MKVKYMDLYLLLYLKKKPGQSWWPLQKGKVLGISGGLKLDLPF